MSDSEEQAKFKFDAGDIARLSTALLLAGFAFSAGQSFYLGMPFLVSYEPKDFLINSIVLMPITFGIILGIGVIDIFLINPARAVIGIADAAKIVSKKERSRATGAALILLLMTLLVPALALSMLISNLLVKYALAATAIGVFHLAYRYYQKLARTQFGYLEIVERNKGERLEKNLANANGRVNTISVTFTLCAAMWIASASSVNLQDRNTIDALLLFEGKTEPLPVNLLASNSNMLAALYDGKVTLISRSSITQIILQGEFPKE